MDQKILVFSGKKQSGKSSAANFVVGYILTQMGRRGHSHCPTNFTIDDDGQLIVNTISNNIVNETNTGEGILDLNRKDIDFISWASNIMWPNVKIYSFADLLKYIAIMVFGIDPQLVYGTDEDKNKPTNITWKDMCKLLPPRQIGTIKNGGKYDMKMTSREFLQYFGTNICRVLDDDCWTRSCINEIMTDVPELAIIQDCRFANEVRTIKNVQNADVKVIKLTRDICFDVHESESGLKGLSNSYYDLIIDNEKMTIREKNQVILDFLYGCGWFADHVKLGE